MVNKTNRVRYQKRTNYQKNVCIHWINPALNSLQTVKISN